MDAAVIDVAVISVAVLAVAVMAVAVAVDIAVDVVVDVDVVALDDALEQRIRLASLLLCAALDDVAEIAPAPVPPPLAWLRFELTFAFLASGFWLG